jgi:hypothetical protein
MFRKLSFYFSLVLLVALSTSCEPKMTLQRYFYQAQENGDFMLIDLPTSLLGQSLDNLNDQQRETLLSVRKVSALIYSDASKADFIKQQQSVINEFLERDGFEPLLAMKMNDEAQVAILVQGSIDEIDEAVFFGYADDKGFILARVLGKNMNPEAFYELASTLEESEIESLTQGMFKQFVVEEQL